MTSAFAKFRGTLIALSVIVLVDLAGAARADEAKPDCHILSIGIDAYLQSPLKGCINDAKNIASQFKNQDGRLFNQVHLNMLLDGQATKAGIDRGLEGLRRAGKSGDFIVLFMSGHGGRFNNDKSWYFVSQDCTGQPQFQVTDRLLLGMADALASEGKKVFIIIDACFCGQLRANAKSVLNKTHANGGGVVLMVSSMPGQTSAALGAFSAYAQAVNEGMGGKADLDGDGYVTLREVRRFAYNRCRELIRKGEQDGEIDYSMGISENLKLAYVTGLQPQVVQNNTPAPALPAGPGAGLVGSEWTGSENLANFGALTFRLGGDNQATMIDAEGSTNGRWTKQGNRIVLSFNNGRTHYVGVLQGDRIQGTARGSRGNTWGWSVTRQEGPVSEEER